MFSKMFNCFYQKASVYLKTKLNFEKVLEPISNYLIERSFNFLNLFK
jgi:hypothetical protein